MKADRPQRLSPPAPPGVLLKPAFGVAQRVRLRHATFHEPTYLALIRQLPCLKCGMEPCGEAAHVRMQSAAHGKRGGIGKKPADKFAVPLCAACHTLDPDSQHKLGEAEFWARFGINPLLVAEQLYAVKGDYIAMRAVIIRAIARQL